jgi:HEAT repeat protein
MGLFRPNIEKLKNTGNIFRLKECLNHKNADVRFGAFSALAERTDLDDELVTKLKSMLKDPSRKVRTIATLKFADSSDVTTEENMKEIISGGSQREKIDLLHIIAGRYKNSDENANIIQIVALAMIDKDKLVKLKAIQVAGESRSSHFVRNLADCLNDKLKLVRINALESLYKIGSADSISCLVGLLVDRDSEVQKTAQFYLSLVDSERSRIALHDYKFQQLVRGLNNIESVRRDTALKIGVEEIREGLPLLYTVLKDEYQEVRIAALKAIAKFKDPSSVNFVAKLLKDKYQNTRLEAVRTLGQIISKESLTALESVLQKEDWNVREEAKKAYYKLKSRGI